MVVVPNNRPKDYMDDTPLENIFLEAVDTFPFPNVCSTGCTQGDLEQQNAHDVEYSEEFTFDAGTICNMSIDGGGWIDCRKEDDRVSISGIFALAREDDWKNKRILPDGEYLQCWYDLDKKVWSCDIDLL